MTVPVKSPKKLIEVALPLNANMLHAKQYIQYKITVSNLLRHIAFGGRLKPLRRKVYDQV